MGMERIIEEKHEKICCCCGLCSFAIWTRVIAISEIIAFLLAGIEGTIYLVHQYQNTTMTISSLMMAPTRETLTVAQAKEHLDFGDVAFPPYVYILRLVVILLLVLLPGIILAGLLFYASLKRKPIYMTAWTVHAIACMIMYTLMSAVMGTFALGFGRLVLFIFCLWIVQVHKRQLEQEEERRLPALLTSRGQIQSQSQGQEKNEYLESQSPLNSHSYPHPHPHPHTHSHPHPHPNPFSNFIENPQCTCVFDNFV